MKIFLTGPTGFIGRVVAERLVARGHHVQGLVRSETAAAKVRALGADAVFGDLNDPAAIALLADKADGVIHLGVVTGSAAFDPETAFAADDRLLEAWIEAYRGSGRVVVTTSGGACVCRLTPGLGSSIIHSEETPFVPSAFIRPRVDMEIATLAALTCGVRGIVIRPPHVYGRRGCYAVRMMIDCARRAEVSHYVGPGENYWTQVHVDDLADLYALAFEQAPGGNIFNASSGENTMREVAEAIGQVLNLPTESWTMEQSNEGLGNIAARLLSATFRMDSSKAHVRLGWKPYRTSLLQAIAEDTV